MGCSIKENAKVWKIRRFTDDFVCDMIFMLGGFREEAAVLRGEVRNKNTGKHHLTTSHPTCYTIENA